MALSIKDPETDAMVRRLARARKTSFTGAIRLAVSNELAKEPKKRENIEAILADVRELQRQSAAMPLLTDATDEEILGYDEDGLPS